MRVGITCGARNTTSAPGESAATVTGRTACGIRRASSVSGEREEVENGVSPAFGQLEFWSAVPDAFHGPWSGFESTDGDRLAAHLAAAVGTVDDALAGSAYVAQHRE